MQLDFAEDVGDVVKLRANDDGTTDLWFAGWRVTFYSDPGAKPRVKVEAAPAEAEPAGDKVKAWKSPDEVFLTYDGWNLTFEPAKEPYVQPVHPSSATDTGPIKLLHRMDPKEFGLAIDQLLPEEPIA